MTGKQHNAWENVYSTDTLAQLFRAGLLINYSSSI